MADVLRPSDVARRWQVTEQHVRNLCHRGELTAFRTGRLWRIRRKDMEAYERCAAIGLDNIEENGASSTRERTERGLGPRLARLTG